jgi:hypothetical protein
MPEEGLKHYSPEEVLQKIQAKSPNGNTRMDTSVERSTPKTGRKLSCFSTP